MPNTFTLLNSVTVGAGGSSSISFSSIPQTYTDLFLYLSGRSTGTNGNAQGFCYLTLNGSTSNFTSQRLNQDGTSVTADSGGRFAGYIPNSTATGNAFGTLGMYISNYTLSNNKVYAITQGMENNSTTNYLQGLNSGVFASSAAITSISIGGVIDSNGSSANFAQNSTAYLYGIVKQ